MNNYKHIGHMGAPEDTPVGEIWIILTEKDALGFIANDLIWFSHAWCGWDQTEWGVYLV